MPTKAKKGIRAADDFDDVLAEFHAQDVRESSSNIKSKKSGVSLVTTTTSTTTTATATSTSSLNSVAMEQTTHRSRKAKQNISDEAVVEACKEGD
jgi:hypothetical protein